MRKAKQDWTVGSIVKVGFVQNLKVLEKIPTPGDFMPDKYLLRNPNGQYYEFTPHNGLMKVDAPALCCAQSK